MGNTAQTQPALDAKAIRVACEQISESLSEIETARTQINETLKALQDKYKTPAKIFRKVAFMYHRQTVTAFEEETEEIKELYKSIASA